MWKKVRIVAGVMFIAGMTLWLIGDGIAAEDTTPGTVSDPLVTKSYVDKKIGELKAELTGTVVASDSGESMDMQSVLAYIDDKLAAMESGNVTEDVTEENTVDQEQNGNQVQEEETSEAVPVENASTGMFEVIGPVGLGTQLIFGESTEVIIRAGGAIVIAGENGDGLADLTSGQDLGEGAEVPLQHHMLVSRDDGRGITVNADETYLLIKGDYTQK